MIRLEERLEFLFSFKGIDVLDTNHCVSRFAERHRDMPINFLYTRIKETITKILILHDGKINNYMGVSKSTRVKIPINYRPDRYNPRKMVAVIPTVLDKEDHPINKYDEIEIMVESFKDYKFIGVD